ncbi:MAG: hypothetical protein Tsb009_31160 [Planctomycetaceae bacterium]
MESRGEPANFISVLGASGAGKTVFLGFLLDILTKGTRGLKGLPNGAFSVGVQQQTITALQHRRFPEKTPSESDSWQWVHCEVTHEKRPKDFFDIVTPDFAGEAIAMEVERPKTYPTIRTVARQSKGLLILFDSQRVRDAGRDEDFFAMKLASYLASLQGKNGSPRWRKLKTPVAIVFTKADSCPEAVENPAEFAAANMPGLVQACERSFGNHRFFASGVVGSSVTVTDEFGCRVLVPLHIEPHGIIEPLEWIMQML